MSVSSDQFCLCLQRKRRPKEEVLLGFSFLKCQFVFRIKWHMVYILVIHIGLILPSNTHTYLTYNSGDIIFTVAVILYSMHSTLCRYTYYIHSGFDRYEEGNCCLYMSLYFFLQMAVSFGKGYMRQYFFNGITMAHLFYRIKRSIE